MKRRSSIGMGLATIVALVLTFGLNALAQVQSSQLAGPRGERPTPEFSSMMRDNAAMLGVDSRGGNVSGTLPDAVNAEDYEGVLREVAMLRENFEEIEAFFAERPRFSSATAYAVEGLQALAAIEAAARTGDSAGAGQGVLRLAAACRSCHQEHRVLVLSVPLAYEIR